MAALTAKKLIHADANAHELSYKSKSLFAKVLYCPNKNQSFWRPVVGSSSKTGKDCVGVFD